jgi:hypothetical protein
MTEPAASSTPTTPGEGPAPAEVAGEPRALIERQLQLLGRLAEAGLNLALAIETQGKAAAVNSTPADVAALGDAALAYARAARAVRLTVALQARLVEALPAQDDIAARRRAGERQRRKARVDRILDRVIQDACSDEAEVDRLANEACERLEHDDFYGDLMDRPVSEIIAMVCKDLGLAPDWARLAEEAWAQDEIRSGAAGGTPLATFSEAPEATKAATAPAWLEPHAASP